MFRRIWRSASAAGGWPGSTRPLMIHSPSRSPSMCAARGRRAARLRAMVDLPAPGIPVMSQASWAGVFIPGA